MKKHISGRKVGFVILAVLFVLSIADIILRGAILKEEMLGLANVGEPFITALLSALLMIFILAKKHRVFYILCGAWLGYFVLNQLFGLPGMISTFVAAMSNPEAFTDFAVLIHVFSMVSIIAIGALLIEYMNDGSIYNKAFNTLCAATLIMFLANIVFHIYDIAVLKDTAAVLAILNNLSRMAMLFLFAFFAYDTAKAHLARTKLK